MTTPLLAVFGLGAGELLIILVALTVFVGAVLVTGLVVAWMVIRMLRNQATPPSRPGQAPH